MFIRELMKNKVFIIAFLSFCVNLFIASKADIISDTYNFQRVGEAVNSSINPYIGLKDAYPYPPLSMFISGLNYRISDITGIHFALVNRVIPIVSFIILGFLIVRTKKHKNTVLYALLYFFNPLIILVTSVVGQNDIAVVLLLFIGFTSYKNRPLLSGFTIGTACLIKIYPLFIVPLFLLGLFKYKKNVFRFCLSFFLIQIALWLPFLFLSLKDTLKSVLLYKGFSDFGWGGVVRTAFIVSGKDFISSLLFTQKLSKVGLILFSVFYMVNIRKLIAIKNPLVLSSIIFTAFLVLYPNISIQYLIWVLPFYFMYKRINVLITYSIIGFLCGSYFLLYSFPLLLGVKEINVNLYILLILQIILYLYTFKIFIKDYMIIR